MAVAVIGPIPDSERFVELVEPVSPPAAAPRSTKSGYLSGSGVGGNSNPTRPRRSSARGLQIFTPATLSEKLEEHGARSSARAVEKPAGNSTEEDDGVERFYSPLSSPAILSQQPATDTKQRNRTSEIPVFPVHTNKESGVTRAFRSKTGTNGSISLSILPSAAALSEMLEQQKSTSQTDLSSSTYQPSSTFTRSNVSLASPPDIRRPSAASIASSVNTRPLAIKRKKPALYNPEEATLPVSRSASIDGFTPTSEDGSLSLHGSPARRNLDLATLPVTQTFQTPLRRIPQSDVTPPSTPPTWTGSTHSDSYTDEDGLPISPRSSGNTQLSQTPSVKGRKLQYGGISPTSSRIEGDDTIIAPEVSNRETDFCMPETCNLEEMQDRPGILRRDSDDSTDYEDEDEEEEEEEGESVHNFGLDSFPVPSVVITSAKHTPRMYPVSPVMVDNLTFTPAIRQASRVSTSSRLGPKWDLLPIPTDAEGNQEWDQATELEIRDRVFRAELKKPNKADKIRRKNLQKQFDQYKKPTKLELYEASLLSVRDENGHKIKFGSLFEEKKTIVCFIRHFWCSQCQNYVDAISKVKPEILAKYNMNLVIISNGSWKMIKSYRKMLGNKCVYPIYTDRAKNIYTSLGMTLRTWDAGKEKERGAYIQNSLGASVIAGIKSGVKLPIKPPGDQQLLGGEFILGPGLNSNISFCHRMKTTRGHAEIEEVLASVGINLEEEIKMLGLINNRSDTATPSSSSPYLNQNNNSKRTSAHGISSFSNSPSLATSIINRLHGSNPKQPSATSPPNSPTVSSTGGIGGGMSNSSPISRIPSPKGIERKRSNRLQKKNRHSQSDLRSSVISQSQPQTQSPSTSNLDISRLSLEVKERAERTRPTSSSSLDGDARGEYRYTDFMHGYREDAVPEEREQEDEDDEEERQYRESIKNRERKHSSAPPHLPTPIAITPLSMGFLQVPSTTPPLFNSNSVKDSEQRRRSISHPASSNQQGERDPMIDEIDNGYLKQQQPQSENGLHQTSSRFSEDSEDDNIDKRDSKRASEITAGTRNSSTLNKSRSFIKSFNL